MANEQSGIKFFVIYTILLSLVTAEQAQESNPLMDLAQTLLKESVQGQNGFAGGLAALGGLAQGFMQNDNVKQMLSGKANAPDLLAGVGATITAALQGQNNDGGDPNILGAMVDIFSSLSKASTDSDNNNVDENNNDNEDYGKRGSRMNSESNNNNIDWETMASFAGNLIQTFSSGNNDQGSNVGVPGFESMLSLLPVLMNTIGGTHNKHSSSNIPHHDHESFLPPFLENFHEYWDHFRESEFGKSIWQDSGLEKLIQSGDYFESLENNTIRRKWIKSLSSFIADWIKYFADPNSGYLQTFKVLVNGFLQAQGFPKKTLIDFSRISDSTSELINYVMKKNFDLKVDSIAYVKPAVSYIQDVFTKSQASKITSSLTKEEIKKKLSETLEVEIIEPMVRLNRGYKYTLKKPKCDRYVICVLNHERTDMNVKIGIKPIFNKIGSFVSAWFMSNNSKTPVLELYGIIVARYKCSKFNQNCDDFVEEDIRATTEYYHNEL